MKLAHFLAHLLTLFLSYSIIMIEIIFIFMNAITQPATITDLRRNPKGILERIKKEKELAEKRLQQKESESHQLKGQIRQYERERSEIREKLEKILGHFERLDLP